MTRKQFWGIIILFFIAIILGFLTGRISVVNNEEPVNEELIGAVGTLTIKQKLATALIETGFNKMGTTTPFTTTWYKSNNTEEIYECLLHNIRLIKNPTPVGVTYTVNCK